MAESAEELEFEPMRRHPVSRTVDVFIRSLRKALNGSDEPDSIRIARAAGDARENPE